jgi:hypothetical protein
MPCHCEARSNRKDEKRLCTVRDCFVPRNDIVVIAKRAVNPERVEGRAERPLPAMVRQGSP